MSLLAPSPTASPAPGRPSAPRAGRVLSGLKPTGALHLGNHLSALRPLAAASGTAADPADVLVMVADLHALTVEHDPQLLRERTREYVALFLAAGVDPCGATIFVQSHVPQHRTVHMLLEALTGVGEAQRMTQYRERTRGGTSSSARLALLTYPVLMAADVLLYDVARVPVGTDQAQHLELARTIARRANARYGAGLVVPEAVTPPTAQRVMDLRDPARKMEKSNAAGDGVLRLLDPPDVLRRTVMSAVTDSDTGPDAVRHDPVAKPGVATLLDLLAACTGVDPAYAARGLDSYGELKSRVADVVVAVLEPLQQRYAEVVADDLVDDVLADGRRRATALAADVVTRLEDALGLLPVRA